MTNFDPVDADVQEARSNILAAGCRVLALSSGRFAIFSRGTVLHGIYDTLREEIIREHCEAEMRDYLASMDGERAYRASRASAGPVAVAAVTTAVAESADEIGL